MILRVQCAHCRGAVELGCKGLQGFLDYESYNEYACPHCRKKNVQKTPGTIVSARFPVATESPSAATA